MAGKGKTNIEKYLDRQGMDYLDLAVNVRNITSGNIKTSPHHLKAIAEGKAEPKYILAVAITQSLGLHLKDMADVFPGIDFAKQA